MDRDNFYILLELSIDPPENNPTVIVTAIKKKQSEWSRFRNHPTKALQAKQYIGLLPEIKKVMSDAELRAKEARDAKKILAEKEKGKVIELDKHLKITLSKGFITNEEIAQLAKIHSLPENDIRDRIEQKKQEKLLEMDKQLALKMSKGYITEDEIVRLAKLHIISEEEVRSRVTCPIEKTAKGISSKVKPLDKALEKGISENLRIIGKASLYDFLDMSPSSSIEILQRASKERESEILKVRSKDANITASGILAGHCIAIFKSEETKASYDITIASYHYTELNTVIDVAGMDGKIRSEYLSELIKTGLELGMDEEEAKDYIIDYAKQKGWEIISDIQDTKIGVNIQKILKIFFYIAFLLSFVGGLAYVGVSYYLNKKQMDAEYKNLILTVDKKPDLEVKQKLLQDYINSHEQSDYTINAKEKINQITKNIEDRDFKEYFEKAENDIKNNQYETAYKPLHEFSNKYPNSPYIAKIKTKIDEVAVLIDKRDFTIAKELTTIEPDIKIKSYFDYLTKHPNGKYKNEINQLIYNMNEEYYIFVKNKIEEYGKTEEWEKCIEISQNYIDIYVNNKRCIELFESQNIYYERLKYRKIFEGLVEKAEGFGTDYKSAKQVFTDYLQAYSKSPITEKINKHLEIIAANEELKRREQAKEKVRAAIKKSFENRFIENNDSILTDKKTGLMWYILDSSLELGKCINYKDAQAYIKSLNIGGYTDWRIPNINELKGVLNNNLELPVRNEKWYWTSNNFMRFADGWKYEVVDVLKKVENNWVREQFNSSECGAVQAVRP
ncbi:MAG: DUF1566 domain-containing protein [Desulfobacterales bacterium]|nr:DUF1566 domain-containing protein [Desulfobacterales bacterium]